MSRLKNKIEKFWVLCIVLTLCAGWMMAVSPVWSEEDILVSSEKPTLDSKGRKDPFKSFIDTAAEVKKEKPKGGGLPLSPLQRQNLSVFNLVGITGNDQDGWRAIMEDGEKKFYPIVEGTLIGIEQGRVVSIESDRVIVAVKSADQKGKTNHITMMLHKDIEGTP